MIKDQQRKLNHWKIKQKQIITTRNTIYILLILLSFGVNFMSAQGENDNWYFGDKAAVNFSTSPPTAINNSAMNTYEACGSVSDSDGNLLFYTALKKFGTGRIR